MKIVFASFKVTILGGVAAVLSVGCASAPKKPATIPTGNYSYMKQYLSWMIPRRMAANDVTGLSIAVVDDQEIVWAEGFGFADKSGNVPAMPETLYEVGSISKLFTVTAAIQLVEQGKVDLDQPLSRYLPSFAIKSRYEESVITPRTIMTHHSGIPSGRAHGMWAPNPRPFTELVDLLKSEYTAYPTNFVFSYSNVAMTLLGHMVQEVTQQPFDRYMEEAILEPLGMKHSSFALRPDMEMLVSKGYSGGREKEIVMLRDRPAGSLRSNVLELSEFVKMVFAQGRAGDHQILRPETLAMMLNPQNADIRLDLDLSIGLSWFLDDALGFGFPLKTAGHDGATVHFYSLLMTLPEHKLAAIVLTNSNGGSSVIGPIVAKALQLGLETKTGMIPLSRPSMVDSPIVEFSDDRMARDVGHYVTQIGLISMRPAGRFLEIDLMGNRLRLVCHADGTLSAQPMLLGLFPLQAEAGLKLSVSDIDDRTVLIAHRSGRRFLFGEKISPKPIPKIWTARTGRYEVANGQEGGDTAFVDHVEFAVADGFLVVSYEVPDFGIKVRQPIEAVNDTEAVFLGLGRRMGETLRIVTEKGEDRLQFSGYIFRKVEK